jgi:hypothetical protein
MTRCWRSGRTRPRAPRLRAISIPRRLDLILAGAAFVLYAITLADGVGWDDSAELAAGIERLGIVHQTGYPPYLLLGHLFPGSANLWSAVCMAAAVGLTARYVLVVGGGALGACVAALLLGVGPLAWYHATTASVYPFFLLALVLMLTAAQAWMARPGTARLVLFAASIGLVLVSHKTGLAFAIGALVLVALRARGRELLGLAALVLPLLTIAYIPLRDGFTGFPNLIGGASTWEWVTGTAGGAPDADAFGANAYALRVHTGRLVVLLLASLSPAALLLVPLGVRALWSERAYLLCCLAPALAVSAVVLTTQGAYPYWHLPLLLAGAVACGVGVAHVKRPVVLALCAIALLVPVAVGASYIATAPREAEGWARATLEELPPDARLVAPWTAYAPLRAVQELDGVREDVRVEPAPVDVRLEDVAARVPGPGFGVVLSEDTAGATEANFKGLSGLDAGPFRIGYEETYVTTQPLR